MEHRGARSDEAQPRRRAAAAAARALRARRRCCTSARANGIRASRCRAGRWPASGAHDGVPVWRDPALLADEDARLRLGPAAAGGALHRRAGAAPRASPPSCAVPGYEDAFYYLWKEGTLPVNSIRCRATSTIRERRRLAGCSARPRHDDRLRAAAAAGASSARDGERWQSSRWTFRRGRMYLVPGNSPMGYRLPLDSLALGAAGEARGAARSARCSSRAAAARRRARPGGAALQRSCGRRRSRATGAAASRWPMPRTSSVDPTARAAHRPVRRAARRPAVRLPAAADPPRALPRSGRQHRGDRRGAAACRWCSRATSRRATRGCGASRSRPIPGVIEVNIHPARSWGELREHTEVLYEEARQARLGTEKFMLDGRHTGTGGGNHVTIGGPTPADSPVLRRPDLLRSLVTYWQHHPSLSYLFSGLFVGPTSQAPRVDEARDDSLYELEIAFQQMPPGEVAAAVAGRPPAAPPADRRHRQHAPRRVLHRQAVLAGHAPAAASGWSSCAPSRCRRTPA